MGKVNKIDKSLVIMPRKKEKGQMTRIRNETWGSTPDLTDPTEIKRIKIKEYN